jgi:hypothetical protein
VVGSAQPGQVEQTLGEGGAECAGEMVALLAPVQAVADERATARGECIELDAELADGVRARVGEAVFDIATRSREAVRSDLPGMKAPVAARQEPPVQQRGHQGDGEAAAQVVIAIAGLPNGVSTGPPSALPPPTVLLSCDRAVHAGSRWFVRYDSPRGPPPGPIPKEPSMTAGLLTPADRCSSVAFSDTGAMSSTFRRGRVWQNPIERSAR